MSISLFTPQGLILTTWGPIILTKGAIYSGISRSSMLIGLLYLSKNISLSQIKFSGTLGIIIRDTFHYFNQLTSGEKIKFSNMIVEIDNKLLNLKPYSSEDLDLTKEHKKDFNLTIFIITLFLFLLDKILYTF